jgi:hypothetical protein
MHHCSEYSGLVHNDHIAVWLLKDLPHVLQTVDFGGNSLNQQHDFAYVLPFFSLCCLLEQDYYKSLPPSQLLDQRGSDIIVINPGNSKILELPL